MTAKNKTETVENVKTVEGEKVETEKAVKAEKAVYSKKAVLKMDKFLGYVDLLGVLLEDGKKYGIEEVEKLIRGDK
jgi:hypothetical protein